MTLGGWINLTLSLGFVLGLFGWCVWKLLRTPDADTPDHLAHIEPVHHDDVPNR
ncbi:MAG: hypothetical protein MUE42_14295 [Opitutaceae bacterium]|jgi:hypothetical protein|nr:hypothetical protein [Opitutaceae bacterium]